MKGKGENRNLEELFREKLGEYNFEPSAGFWSGFEKKLRFREFLKFRSGKFNIYYLGGILAAATVSLSLLVGIDKAAVNDLNDNALDKPVPDNQITVSVNNKDRNTGSENIITESEKRTENKSEESVQVLVIDMPESEVTESENQVPNDRIPELGEVSAMIEAIETEIVRDTDVSALMPSVEFDTDRESGCVPLSIGFTNLSQNTDSCMWDFGDGGMSYDRDPVWVFDEAGEYEVSLIAWGGEKRVVKKALIRVWTLPKARFEVSSGNPFIPDEQVDFYNYSDNSVAWEWSFGDGDTSKDYEPSHFYEEYGSYTVKLKAISEHGCADSMILTNAFGYNSCFIRFPNAFIPNQGGPTGGFYSSRTDQNQEVFHPVWSGVIEYNLRIYTKQGILIFETDDIDIGWDGYYKGQKADPGVYLWKVRGIYKNGDTFVNGGDITLLQGFYR